MSNVEDFLTYRMVAREKIPVLKPWAFVVQDGPNPEWRHFQNGIPLYNIPLNYDMVEAQRLSLTSYHEPGHEFEEYLRILDPSKAHRAAFLLLIGETKSWDQLKAIADLEANPNVSHELDPGEWWADAFANAIQGEPRVGPWRVQATDPVTLLVFFQRLAGIVQAPVPTYGLPMGVVDIRGQLPLAIQNVPIPSHAVKDSNTIHWTGGSDTVITDAQAVEAIKRWHQEHINKNWAASGYQGGAGLMYHEVIAPSGTVFITRDPDAHTWHCSVEAGNLRSRAILVICDEDDLPTNQQLASLDSRITFPTWKPHGLPDGWIATQCPGPQLRTFIDERRVDDMFTAQDREDLRRIKAQLDAEGPRVWTQRLQDWLSKVFKSVPQYAAPTDYSGPDVTTNNPRS